MQAISRFSLAEIVNPQLLQEIQDNFCEATGLAAVIVDYEGNPVTKPSNFTAFCKYIRSFPKGLARCINCDDAGGRRRNLTYQRPAVYLCHSGLTDLAAPIIVQNEYIGAFLAGQVVLQQEDYDAKAEMFRRTAGMGMDDAALSELFDVVEVVPEKRIKAAADLVYTMSNYIVEMGVANLVQKQLMNEIKAKAELEILLRATEFKALQSQVNPHFLFNALNTIARLALLEGAEQTQEVVYALSDLLRNNLRDVDTLRTVEQEVKSVKDYILIQKVRFGNRIQTFIDIDPQIMDARIPPLTLQPLIENAIVHGLEHKVDGGLIQVSGTVDDGKITIIVRDTGVGVSAENIRGIFRAEKHLASQGQTTGIGIINVHRRIQHYFGNEHGLSIESKPGEGTTISVGLPYRRE